MFIKLKNVLLKTAAILSLAVALNANAAVIKTDIVFIVDESGSMANVQANLRNNIGLFASILTGTGAVDARYGLVGYGSNSSDAARLIIDFTSDIGAFVTAALGLLINGSDEDAFDAVAFALNSLAGQSDFMSYRADAVSNLIILTDEPDRNGVTDFAAANALLTANNALFNAVLDGQNTIDSIGPLATNHGGAVFDLNGLNSNDESVVDAFVTAFANAKLQETLTFCQVNPTDPACIETTPVPVPPLAALFGLAVAGIYMRRKA